MGSLTNKTIASIYKDLFYIDNSNNGIDSTTRSIKDGAGNETALDLSDRRLAVQPSADTTTLMQIKDADGNALFTIDSTNDVVKGGTNAQIVNTQYATFSGTALNIDGSSHLAVPRFVAPATQLTLGTGTDPSTSLTISNTADDVVSCMWYLDTAINIDAVTVWVAGDGASGDTIRFHLMSYSVDTSNGSTGGDLTSGAVIASGGDITNAGYEQAYYQALTVATSSVAQGKALFFTIKGDGTNSNYNVNCQIKYHL
tara:strand:- start:1932 stop:2699 length:768 start_codon:yes stop_codon:yes gene_type:complete